MKRIFITFIALLSMYTLGWSARDPIPHQWTKMSMDDIDSSPYQWDRPCGVVSEIREAGYVHCSATLKVPISGSRLSTIVHVDVQFIGTPAKQGRACYDGTWKTSFSSNLGTTPDGRPLLYGGIGSRTASILVNFGNIEGVNQEVLRRIARDVMRKFELYAWPCDPNSQSEETRKGGEASSTNRPNASEIPDAADLTPDVAMPHGDDLGVLGQSDPCKGSHVAYSDLTGECRRGSDGSTGDGTRTLSAENLYRLGAAYWTGDGVPKDPVRSRQLLHQAAEKGHALAQTWYGRALIEGVGGETDTSGGFQWLVRAAEQGEAESEHSLGMAYFHGWGTEIDMHKGCEWQRKAAAQGHAWGVHMAGGCDFDGEDGPKNPAKGVVMFKRVLEMGNSAAAAAANNRLGWAYEKGVGVERDLRRAADYYRRSAENGYMHGQFNYASVLEHGIGVERNEAESLRWYRRAEQSGNQDASAKVKELSERVENR
ncbi:MAG: tetratricopeptide repeat protein [Nitrospirales bacterium]